MLDMRNPVQPVLAPPFADLLSMRVEADGGRHVVYLDGELDVANRGLVLLTCAAVEHRTVTADLSRLTFMDCTGYSGMVAARLVLEARGGSLTLDHITGQPLRLLTLLDGLIGCRDADGPATTDHEVRTGEIESSREFRAPEPHRRRPEHFGLSLTQQRAASP